MINRSEHPCPSFVRANWQSLNGTWSLAFDDKDIGLREQWFMDADHFTQNIEVPFLYDCPLSGVEDDHVRNTVWYRRTFTLPEEMRKHTVLMHFGGIYDACEVYVNTFKVDEHTGGCTSFTLDITDYVSDGENDLCVRCCRVERDRKLPIGIHGTVYLEAAGSPYLTRIHVTPDVSQGMAMIEMALDRVPKLPVTAKLHVTHEGQTVAVQSVEMHGKQIRTCVDLSEKLMLWSPETPDLYDLSVEISGGDMVYTYFGMRAIGMRQGLLCVNEEPVFLKIATDRGCWPESGETAPNREALHADIRKLMRLGFNAVLKYGKPEDPRYLYRADRAGVLVLTAMPGKTGKAYDAVLDRGRMFAEAIDRDYNCPSIVAYLPEEPTEKRTVSHGRKNEAERRMLCEAMLALDGTRLVLTEKTGEGFEEASGAGDLLRLRSLDFSNDSENVMEELEQRVTEVLSDNGVGGCIRHGLADTPQEKNGLLTEDRAPKVDMTRYAAQMNRLG